MPRSNIKCEHLRIDLRGANRFVAHQALQNLQWYASVQHVHRVGVTECMGVTGTENVTPSAAAASTASLSGAHSTVCDLPDTRLLHFAGALVSSFQWNFQGCHHHLQLADVVVIGKRNQTMSLTTGRRSACCSGRFLGALLERGQLHERIRWRQRKIPGSAPAPR